MHAMQSTSGARGTMTLTRNMGAVPQGRPQIVEHAPEACTRASCETPSITARCSALGRLDILEGRAALIALDETGDLGGHPVAD